jgi:uncharacterized membrane protein
VTIIFGLLSAFSYGYADFVGALAAKRIRAMAVTTYSFTFGILLAIVLALVFGAEFSQSTIIASIFAGICSAAAISFLYAALALGPISIVSPLTAVVSAIIPVVVDVALGTTYPKPATRATVINVVAGLVFYAVFAFWLHEPLIGVRPIFSA